METIKFRNKDEFAQYIINEAKRILKEEKIQNLGTPTDLEMNKKDKLSDSSGAKVKVKETGSFERKTAAPINVPDEFKTTKDPVDVKMTERDGGHDEEIATAAKIEGSGNEKSGSETNPFVKGQAKPNVTSKKEQPKVSADADPTKSGGNPGDKDNQLSMNKEDKEDKTTKPMTQVLGKGEMSKDGFSKGQTNKEVNVKAKTEKDEYAEKVRNSIKTIQLPENFKSKKEMLNFIKTEANRISKIK